MEHHANIVPWQQLAKRKNATLKFIPMTKDGELQLITAPCSCAILAIVLTSLIVPKTLETCAIATILVLSLMVAFISIAKIAHEHGAVISVDGAQSAPHMALDMQDIDADFYSFSGHKMLGPTGIGVLYGKRELLQNMEISGVPASNLVGRSAQVASYLLTKSIIIWNPLNLVEI
jgi:cysteine desulfurase/selenocysteine lyase